MPSKKHYIITAVTLGAIAACSAGLIGLTNLLTRDQIKKNEQKKFNAGITAIFGENSAAHEFNPGSKYDIKYLDSIYIVDAADDPENEIGWAVRTTGSNMYGKISMLVGFDYSSKLFKGIYLITNEQTYATTLVENYVSPLNSGDRQLDDVKCGATYGATLINEMVANAQEYIDGIIYD